MDQNRSLLLEFTACLRACAPGERANVWREAEEALSALSPAEFEEEVRKASPQDVDEKLFAWVFNRLNRASVASGSVTRAEMLASQGVYLVDSGRDVEAGIAMLEEALRGVAPEEDLFSWCRWQHNLGEGYMLRVVGTRDANVEAAVRAFRAALQGRRGLFRVDTLHSLAQAIRQRGSGQRRENREEGRRAVIEAAALLKETPDRRREWRNALERGRVAGDSGDVSSAERAFDEALKLAVTKSEQIQAQDSRASFLCQVAKADPSRRSEAVAAAQSMVELAGKHGDSRMQMIARERLQGLSVEVPLLGVSDIREAEIRFLEGDLLERTVWSSNTRRAVEVRMEREERTAFGEPSCAALTQRETALAPFFFRLASEAARSGQTDAAFAWLARVGGWRVRRLTRWSDLSVRHPRAELFFRASLLEDSLDTIVREAEAWDAHGVRMPADMAGIASDARIRRFISGESDEAVLNTVELSLLGTWPPDERAAAAESIREGISTNISLGIRELGAEAAVEFNGPPWMSKDEILKTLEPGQALLLVVGLKTVAAVAAIWRSRDGRVATSATFFAEPSDREAALIQALDALARRLEESLIDRVAIARRGTLGRGWKALRPVSGRGFRLVHVPGVDKRVPPKPAPHRKRRLIQLFDDEPERNLVAFVPALATLKRLGYSIFPALDDEKMLTEAYKNARGVIVVGHGDGPAGPLGGAVGNMPILGFQEWPLRGCGWALCLSCSSGETRTAEQAHWDHDPGTGASERLLLSGCRAAADCMAPVPVVSAALVAETFAVLEHGGLTPEEAFSEANRGWRRFFAGCTQDLAARLAEWDDPSDEVVTWLVARINAGRTETLGTAVTPMGKEAILGALGPDAEDATVAAAQFLEPFVEASDCFRWTSRA